MGDSRVRVGTLAELESAGYLLTKLDRLPVAVFWNDGSPRAIEDRCPHMGFPLHRGTVESGLVTCHWHHARFDLDSGCTLDLWADDTRAFDAEVDGGDVYVNARPGRDEVEHLRQRLQEGMEDGITLVIAKSVLGLVDGGVEPSSIVRVGAEFGTRYRREGWGAGLTVLVAMANVLPALDPDDRAVALVHALRFLSADTANHAPRFPVAPMRTNGVSSDRLREWYRRFIDTRAADAAERVLQTALASVGTDLTAVEDMMMLAVTDHVFLDGGHTIDFTNKAFELLEHLGAGMALVCLPTLVLQTARAARSEETSEWRYPHDPVAIAEETIAGLAPSIAEGRARRGTFTDVAGLADRVLADDPVAVGDAILDALRRGATEEEVARAVALAAALRIVRFHTQNDLGDWDTVHHTFTAGNALHHSVQRAPGEGGLRGIVHVALRIYLDRFLDVPPARLPRTDSGDLDELAACFEVQGAVEEAARAAYGYLRGGGSRDRLVAALGHALLREDAGFHWYQLFEATARQAAQWPAGSEEAALILTGYARFLAAHTPTRRELPTVISIAGRLRRGENLYEDQTPVTAGDA